MFKFVLCFLISISSIYSQQLQWTLLSDGGGGDSPMPRRDAALGFDSSYLILFGGRDQGGMPMQDSYAFSILTGQWERLDFGNPPPPRYGMASASSIGSGLYIFGGFGMQGAASSSLYNPYMPYGGSGLPSYKQSPAAQKKQKRSVKPKQYFNQMNQQGYSYDDNEDRIDENFQPLPDSWFLNYATKTWQQTQMAQFARGLGSAAASPFAMGGIPRVIYSMGKSRDWMYSTVETSSQITNFNQMGGGQSAMIMYDLSSYSPAYPHARYGHSTTLLTDNHLLLYGGCLSGYGKGGPCPSKDTWLLHVDRGHWERLWECPPTKTGAAMVTLPPLEMCSSMMGPGFFGGKQFMNMGNQQPVAVLWGGRERNPSSIVTYPSPLDEVAVFSLSQKEWFLKRAAPSQTGGGYPSPREGAAYVAGCFQGVPGMFIYGGRSVNDRRILSDLWFLQASPQDAMNAPIGRSCIYPFSFYHLHGIFQFFAYGVIFPIGYLVGRHARRYSVGRPLHVVLQLLGAALAICGFAFGVHAVRAAAWLHFRHAHAIIGIITFILTMIQLLLGLLGALLLRSRVEKVERITTTDSIHKQHKVEIHHDERAGSGIWRLAHRILGALILALGLVNISLGVFLAVLPLPVWIIWFIYLGFLVLLLIGLELISLLRRGTPKKTKLPKTFIEKREDPRGTSQTSLKYVEGPMETTLQPAPRRGVGRGPPPDPYIREVTTTRRTVDSAGEDRTPLIATQRHPRQGDVTASRTLPDYQRPNEREYPISPRKRSGPGEMSGLDYYVGYAPEHEQPLPRSPVQQQSEHSLTRVRLQ